jgi:hypothetical protein
MGHGFDPAVCDECPLQEAKDAKISTVDVCGICSCPTREGLLLDRFDAPPEGCIRLAAHASGQESGDGDGQGGDGDGNGLFGGVFG